MNPKDLISRIIAAKSFTEIFADLSTWKDTYKHYMLLLHPDICHEPGAGDASARLSNWKTEIEKGKVFTDDAGPVVYSLNVVTFKGDPALLQVSCNNFKTLAGLNDSASAHFRNYLPASMEMQPDGTLKCELHDRAVPLAAVVEYFNGAVPQEHVNWITNRMLEFAAWLAQVGYTHCGLNPESVFIVPETHGMICTSFYHFTQTGKRVTGISGKYLGFYPAYLLDPLTPKTAKVATPLIDTELATRTAVYLLGDKSGLGSKLRKTHNNELLDFYSSIREDASDAFFTHRDLVKKLFPVKFYTLNI